MDGFNPIMLIATLALAAGALGATATLPQKMRPIFVYAQLVLMVGIYVGFSVVALDQATIITRSDWSALLIEAIFALGFLFAGLILLDSGRGWMLGALILGHGGVDLSHLLMDAAHTPAWYVYLCAIFDAIVGLGAIYLLSERAPAPAE